MATRGKHPGGRPTTYKPEYCQQAIDFLAQGYSITALAGHLRTNRRTIYDWAEANPEFSYALTEGQARSAEWWEQRAIELGKGGNNNAAIVIFALKNRVAHDWRDKRETEHSGSGLVVQIVQYGESAAPVEVTTNGADNGKRF